MVLGGKFDPYTWVTQRQKGRSLYFVDNGLSPGLIAAISYAALMAFLGSESSPYLNAVIFAVFTTPIYVWISHRVWESNEDALATFIVERAEMLRGGDDN